MKEKSCVMLRILLNRYHQGAAEAFLKGLPEEDMRKVLNIPISSGDITPLLTPLQERIGKIHYSWFLPRFKEMPKNKLALILSLMPEPHRSKLPQLLNVPLKEASYSKHAISFLTSQLYQAFELESVYPVEYLPKSDMEEVVHLKKGELVDLIDFLGLHDLAEEVHHIVDKKLLERIYESLTHKKQQFLRTCLHMKEKLVTQRLHLEKWDGHGDKLAKLLHHRGMTRLGYALSGQHPDFLWHVTHILDTGRGEKLSRFYQKEEIPSVTNALKKQVKSIIKFFKTKE